MIYKFLLLSDEVANFERIIDIDSEATFLEFQKAILESVKYGNSDLSTFYICSENWEKEQEIMFMEMNEDTSVDNYLMGNTKLNEFIEDKGQRLLFVFDMLTERAFFIELQEIIPGKNLKKPVCSSQSGKPPMQNIQFDELFENNIKKANVPNILDDDFYGDDGYNDDEFDAEGYSDLSFDDELV